MNFGLGQEVADWNERRINPCAELPVQCGCVKERL